MIFRSSIAVLSSGVDAPAVQQAFGLGGCRGTLAAEGRSRQHARDLRGLAGSDRPERYYTGSGPSRVAVSRTAVLRRERERAAEDPAARRPTCTGTAAHPGGHTRTPVLGSRCVAGRSRLD